MPTADLHLPVTANVTVPWDHGYALFGAVTRVLPEWHDRGVAVHPLVGRLDGQRRLRLPDDACLVLRITDDDVTTALRLCCQSLHLPGCTLRVGKAFDCRLVPLAQSSTLHSRLVTVKRLDRRTDEAAFAEAVRWQLDRLDVSQEATVVLGKRRTLRVRDKEVVGYETTLAGLSAPESLRVQAVGLGGRRAMGCGVFAPG